MTNQSIHLPAASDGPERSLMMAPNPEPLPAVLSVITASRLLGIGKNAAYDLIRQGKYPVRVLSINGRYKISKYDLLAYLGAPGYGRPEVVGEIAS